MSTPIRATDLPTTLVRRRFDARGITRPVWQVYRQHGDHAPILGTCSTETAACEPARTLDAQEGSR